MAHHGRISPLEGIDRLFEITDDKQRARPFLAGLVIARLKELVAQPSQKPPLRRTCVLGLVEKHMPDAVVQLPADPLGRIALAEHAVGQPDEIVIIQKAALHLQPVIETVEGPAEFVKRRAQLETAMCRLRCNHACQCVLRSLLHSDNARERLADGCV